MSRIILIDGKNLAYRIHATHSTLSSHGFPTSILYGVPVAMLTIAKKFPGAALVFIWDGDGTTWRHRLLTRGKSDFKNTLGESARIKSDGHEDLPPYMRTAVNWMQGTLAPMQRPRQQTEKPKEKPVGYKANRTAHHANFVDAAKQLPVFKEFLTNLGVRQFEFANLEGDDLMGLMVTHIERHEIFNEIIIYSSDRDFYQFISDKTKVLRSEREGGFASVEEIREKFGVDIKDYTRLRSITGDTSDNIPHLFHKVGPKTAAKWIAMGLDPSLENWMGMPAKVRERLKEINSKFDLEGRWAEIHTNYLVSQIVRTPEHKLLPDKLKTQLTNMLSKVSRGYLLSDKRKRTEDGWRWLSDYLAKYEMTELLARRNELWQLP